LPNGIQAALLRNVIFRDMLHSTKSTNFSLPSYRLITDKVTLRAGFAAVVWRPLV